MRTIGAMLLVMAWTTGCSQRPEPPKQEKAPSVAPVKITQFYGSAGIVLKGEAVTICYGVENAASVRIEPAVKELRPAFNRCFETTPASDTTYKLIAEGSDGKTVSQSFTVKVGAKASGQQREHLIRFLTVSSKEVPRGQTVTLCYSAPDATSVTIKPAVKVLKPADQFCFAIKPPDTTTYTISATGAGGKTDELSITVTVR